MRVLVLGAGVIGVTTAYELSCDGHDVTVIDRNVDVANETSFANAGMVACGHAFAWASPRAPKMMMKSLVGSAQPIRFRPQLDLSQWSWALAFLGQCTAGKSRRNTKIKHRLCTYSQSRLKKVVLETGVDFDSSTRGLLYFHRSKATLARGVSNMRYLESLGQKITILDSAGIARVEPSLQRLSGQIAGGIFSDTDESGDARLFTIALANRCRERGVEFRLGEAIEKLAFAGGQITGVKTANRIISADAYIVCMGPWSARFVRGAGVSLPVYPVKGYSVTFPLKKNSSGVPLRGVVDEDNLLAVTPFESRLRATSVAEISGYDSHHRPSQFSPMISRLRALLPDAADYDRPTFWAGLRPMTPDGPPRIGKTKVPRLLVNTGQGHMGWTMACGSARILADILAEKRPEIPMEGLELSPA